VAEFETRTGQKVWLQYFLKNAANSFGLSNNGSKKIQAFELFDIVKSVHCAVASDSNPGVERDCVN
jgi:hypothetical protein